MSLACTDSFGTPRALGEVWKASLDGCCMYKCENDSIVPEEYNCSNIPQPVCTRTGEISVNLADDNSCCPHRACGLFHNHFTHNYRHANVISLWMVGMLKFCVIVFWQFVIRVCVKLLLQTVNMERSWCHITSRTHAVQNICVVSLILCICLLQCS